ncbi:MAG: type II toxin-antitoxin system VapB family antitoxin [Candidatus Marinimicrobia bacterium]|nr:type II toxin-antitoxin system VapB family antitoxin [Candidatus Neomarinimicrobiota bacterium]MBL7009765.1 type II toxin-antitoxin system VapB family antitoxin [Candidatus Neomarinimicrobiota bacterium]MBL7029831.1 type II toxin-antitoxin system VapB family antitoxin [Candidatus Neomarinimicrobiota bacterium]
MRTTLDIDNSLVEAALAATGLKTKKAVIEAGLKELISSNNIDAFVNSFGAIDDFDLSAKEVRKWREQEESIIEPGSVNEPPIS